MKDKQGIFRGACKEKNCECTEYEYDGSISKCAYCDHAATKHRTEDDQNTVSSVTHRDESMSGVTTKTSGTAPSLIVETPEGYDFDRTIKDMYYIDLIDVTNLNRGALLRLAYCMKDPKRGVEIKNRRWLMRKFKLCFVGSEMVDWLVKNKISRERKDAIMLGNYLYKHNLFEHVTRGHIFKDGKLFYHFLNMDIFSAFALGKATLEDAILNEEIQEKYRAFLKDEYAESNLDFVVEVQRFEDSTDASKFISDAVLIYTKFISGESKNEINLPSQIKKDIDGIFMDKENLAKQIMLDRTEIFFLAKIEIYRDLERDSYKRFVNLVEHGIKPNVKVHGKLHKRFLEATE